MLGRADAGGAGSRAVTTVRLSSGSRRGGGDWNGEVVSFKFCHYSGAVGCVNVAIVGVT